LMSSVPSIAQVHSKKNSSQVACENRPIKSLRSQYLMTSEPPDANDYK
jgi:hypothetical protein